MHQGVQVGHAPKVQVGGVVNASRVVIAHRCGNADAVDGIHMLLSHHLTDLFANIGHIKVGVIVLCGRQVLAGHTTAFAAYQANIGVRATDVNANRIGSHRVILFVSNG